MKPNRIWLLYLMILALALGLTLTLASLNLVLRVESWVSGRPAVKTDGWLVGTTLVALGILPWPGLIVLVRAMVRPRRREDFRVKRSPIDKTTVVLIALNEEQAIERVVRDFKAVPSVGSVVVVDNGSSDRTRELAAATGAQVVREEQRGYGYACMRALTEGFRSGHEAVILCEADQTYSAADVENLLAYLKYADLVVGSRTHQMLLNSDSQLDSFFSIGNMFVAKLLQLRYWDWKAGSRVSLSDVGCTYRAIRLPALQRILSALEVGEDHFGPHMVMVALEHGLRVIEVPVTFWKRVGVSKGGNANWRKGFILGLVMIWHILTYHVRRKGEGVGSSAETASEHPV